GPGGSSRAGRRGGKASRRGAPWRARRTGAASGFARTGSSFGSTGTTGCTNGLVTRARARAGGRSCWRHDGRLRHKVSFGQPEHGRGPLLTTAACHGKLHGGLIG